MALTDAQINDLAIGTLKHLGRLKFNQIATPLQDYVAMRDLFRKEKVVFSGGTGVQRSIMVKHSGAAKNTGLYGVDSTNADDVMKQIEVPYRHTTTNFIYDRREIRMNGGAGKIIDLMKTKRTDAMISLAERFETDVWSKPATSADEETPWGLLYWIVKNSTEGFNGGNAAGFTAGPGGLDSDVYTRWKNYTAAYVNISKQDLVKKMRTAYRKIKFRSPTPIPEHTRGKSSPYRLFTNEALINGVETVGEQQNDNLGKDIASMDGNTVFKKHPFEYVPELDSDSSNPLYMINMNKLHPIFLKGEFLNEQAPKQAAKQHTVWEVHIDTSWNLLCTDRRCQAVLYVA